MQKQVEIVEFTEITPTASVDAGRHGARAKCLQRLVRLEMPVPKTLAMPFSTVRAIAAGKPLNTRAVIDAFDPGCLMSVRPSPQDADWGGPGAILNIGMCDARHADLSQAFGGETADALYIRFIQTYAVHVMRLDPDMFENCTSPADFLEAIEIENDDPFPQDPGAQLDGALRSMARAWEGTSARLLRQAKGAPLEAGLGLVVQEMALGLGDATAGAGVIQFVSSETGQPQVTGRYQSQAQGREALTVSDAIYLMKDPRGPSLEELLPEVMDDLIRFGAVARTRLREEMQIEFAIDNKRLKVLDSVPVSRSPRAAVRIAVDLAQDEVIGQDDALCRVAPTALAELLHRQVSPLGARQTLLRGVAASPGAAVGRVVFSSAAALASAAREEPCILVRRETSSEDIRGMHAAVGVLTERGGMTSHAAVIARGVGLPCVVGASDIILSKKDKSFSTPRGHTVHEGDLITLDGTTGAVLAGEVALLEPTLDETFSTFLDWADAWRDIGVRANADTPRDAQTARNFAAQGIGLCRTEHMFFEDDRLTVMRETIFADDREERRAALDRLLPMQRADFKKLFEIMQGQPVCIRLFDPPLHEFIPSDREGLRGLAEALDRPLSDIIRRVEGLSEYNPMLGLRGVRLGITVPEIYEMQARAIFEAALLASRAGAPVVPEIMVPLVSAKREVELVQAHIDGVAASVRAESGETFDYRFGVMVETPRAALRAGDIAPHTAFLSFGTNDLTQMTYGLSRDDAGRFMGEYVRLGVYPEDPFHNLDIEGVGELLMIGAERGRSGRADVVLSICGEHGGDAESIQFCRRAGFDYVSCSPFRVPVARLAAAQLAIRDAQNGA